MSTESQVAKWASSRPSDEVKPPVTEGKAEGLIFLLCMIHIHGTPQSLCLSSANHTVHGAMLAITQQCRLFIVSRRSSIPGNSLIACGASVISSLSDAYILSPRVALLVKGWRICGPANPMRKPAWDRITAQSGQVGAPEKTSTTPRRRVVHPARQVRIHSRRERAKNEIDCCSLDRRLIQRRGRWYIADTKARGTE